MTAYAEFLPSPTILRFDLQITDEQILMMPAGAHPLHVAAAQWGPDIRFGRPRIDLWCHADPHRPAAARRFHVLGTGNPAPVDPARHVGTVVFDHPGGRGVWHVFDAGETSPTDAAATPS